MKVFEGLNESLVSTPYNSWNCLNLEPSPSLGIGSGTKCRFMNNPSGRRGGLHTSQSTKLRFSIPCNIFDRSNCFSATFTRNQTSLHVVALRTASTKTTLVSCDNPDTKVIKSSPSFKMRGFAGAFLHFFQLEKIPMFHCMCFQIIHQVLALLNLCFGSVCDFEAGINDFDFIK